MAIALSASITSPAIPATQGPSRSRLLSSTIAAIGLSLGQATGPVCFYIGTHASGAPAVFSDLTNPIRVPGSEGDGQDSYSVTLNHQTSTFTIQLRQSGDDGSALVVGDRTFLCMFFVDPPIAGSAVIASALLPLVVA